MSTPEEADLIINENEGMENLKQHILKHQKWIKSAEIILSK